MKKTAVDSHKGYLERITLYKSFCYDIEAERKFIIEKAKPFCSNILEVGTGKGYLTVALAKEGYKFRSVDISEQEQKFARLNIEYFGLEKQVDFKIENAERLTFENGYFDVIFSVNTLHHLTNPFKVINELIRVVSSDGKIILSDFSKEGLELIDEVHASEGRKHHVGEAVLSHVNNYLSDKGFKIDKHRSKFQEILIGHH